MNKAQSNTLDELHELIGRTHQRLHTLISPNEIKVTLDDMVEGIIDENGEVSWKYTRGSLCDGCQYEFTPRGVNEDEL